MAPPAAPVEVTDTVVPENPAPSGSLAPPAETPARRPTPRVDPAERLLAARDVDEEEDEEDGGPSPQDLQFVERIRSERARRAKRRRGLVLVAVAALVAIVAVALSVQRAARTDRTAAVTTETPASEPAAPQQPSTTDVASAPTAVEETARPTPAQPETARPEAARREAARPETARPEPARPDPVASTPPPNGPPPGSDVALPPRTPPAGTRLPTRSRETSGGTTSRSASTESVPESSALPARRGVQIERPNEPAALASTAAAPAPPLRVDVKQSPVVAASPSAPRTIDYTVRVSQENGGPVADADVRLRGITTDGVLVEAQLDPASEPGVYRGIVPVTPRGPNNLTVRVVRPDGVVEVPVASAPGGR